MKIRTWIEGALTLLVVLIVVGYFYEHRGDNTVEAAIAHHDTVIAQAQAASAETVFVERKAAAARAETVYVASRAAALARLTDTVLVKETIARADTVILRDSIALAGADSAIARHVDVERAMNVELAIAKTGPSRLSASASAMYDPLSQIPAASASGALRLIGNVSVGLRGDQRFAPGEKPHGYLVATISF